MKIGIVTFWWSQENYGQLLQCFATQKYLQQLGHDAFLIRVRNFLKEPSSETSAPMPVWKKLLSWQHWRFLLRSIYERCYQSYINSRVLNHDVDRQFDDFREKYIVSTERVYSHDELLQDSPEVDILATGSDMAWGVGLHHHEYLLDFGKAETRRISIAASFGRTWESLNESEKEICKKYISRYDAITVREEEGVRICRNLGMANAVRVCDPTMLLDTSVYEKLMNCVSIPDSSDKAFIYYIGYDDSYLTDYDIVSVLKEKNLQYHYASAGRVNALPKVFPTIPQWLKYIHDSRFVVTNSFHGVIFCLLFKKQFAVIPLKLEQRNTRIQTILREFGLEDRICTSKMQLISVFDTLIDFHGISTEIENYQKRSRGIIDQIFLS